MNWLSKQFTTRVIVLIPIAIALNIVLGFITQTVLRLPIYLDSIGTILVGVLAGPIAGAATGAATNLIWQFTGITPNIGPFFVTAAVIGFLAGLWGYLGIFRPRPASGTQLVMAAAIAAGIVGLLVVPIIGNPTYLDPDLGGFPEWAVPAAIIIAILAALAVAAFIYVRRDLAGLWVALAGALTGIVAAIVSAPIAAYVFGGVTGSGTDVIVAALRQGGADVFQAALGQGFFSDPIDKVITSFVVFVLLAGLSRRLVSRFPLGDRLGPTSEPMPGSSADN
jgi:energy-coupling factor transport system substrate-specific component